MTNQEVYRFEQFTIENYREMLQLAKNSDFEFASFHTEHKKDNKVILWRHDVEFSPFIALRMAEIEAEEAIKATYFFQLHGELYNTLEKAISQIVRRIQNLGHDIGLHFDSHYFDVKNEFDLEKSLKIDTDYFNKIFDCEIKSFSFHNTNKFILTCEKKSYAGLINVYSEYFKTNFEYCTDSTGFWRYEPLDEVLRKSEIRKLHILIHDSMWSDLIQSPRQRVFESIDSNAERQKKWYDKTLHDFGAKNVDWDEVYE